MRTSLRSDQNSGRNGWRRLFVLLLVVAGLTSPGAIDSAEAAAPEKIIETTVLDNGLKIISIEDHSLPIVTIEMALRHGAFAESPEFDGLSHLYEHMFFKGNAAIPDQEAYLQRMKELGIVFNGTTSTERVNYFFTLPTSNLQAGMQFMEHALRTPKFNEKEFAKEKKIVLSEYDRAESSPSYAFQRTMQRKLWYEYPSRKITLGSRKAIANATVEQMREIKETYYVPNNAALIVAGDVSADRAFALGKQVFADWEKGADPFEANPVPEHPPLKDTEIFIQEGDVKVPTVDIRWQGPSVDESPQATYAADVLSFILSQPSSKFHEALVDSAITLNAGVSYYTQAHTGPIMARASVQRDKIRKAIERLFRELHKLADPDYFTDQQLSNAKTILETRDIYSREKTSQYAHTISFWWAVDDIDYYLNYIESLNQVTRQDIASYVEEYILDEPYVLGVLLSPQDRKAIDLTEKELQTMVSNIEAKLENGGTDQ